MQSAKRLNVKAAMVELRPTTSANSPLPSGDRMKKRSTQFPSNPDLR
jgi:hypothetical protein